MRLGTDTGSVTNWMMATPNSKVAEAGTGATILCWTDRQAATIVKVTPKTVHVQRDIATRIDKNGMSESQEYSYTPNPKALVEVFRLTKTGWRNPSGFHLSIGHRDEYYDYSF